MTNYIGKKLRGGEKMSKILKLFVNLGLTFTFLFTISEAYAEKEASEAAHVALGATPEYQQNYARPDANGNPQVKFDNGNTVTYYSSGNAAFTYAGSTVGVGFQKTAQGWQQYNGKYYLNSSEGWQKGSLDNPQIPSSINSQTILASQLGTYSLRQGTTTIGPNGSLDTNGAKISTHKDGSLLDNNGSLYIRNSSIGINGSFNVIGNGRFDATGSRFMPANQNASMYIGKGQSGTFKDNYIGTNFVDAGSKISYYHNNFNNKVFAYGNSFTNANLNTFNKPVNAFGNSFAGAKFNTFNQHINALGSSFSGANNNIFNSTLKASNASFANAFKNTFNQHVYATGNSFAGANNNIFKSPTFHALGNSFSDAFNNTFKGDALTDGHSFKNAFNNTFDGRLDALGNSFAGAKLNTFNQHVNTFDNAFAEANSNIFKSTLNSYGNSLSGAFNNTFIDKVTAYGDSFKNAFSNTFNGQVNTIDNAFAGAKLNTFNQHVNAYGNAFAGANNNTFNSTLKASGTSFSKAFDNTFKMKVIALDHSFAGAYKNNFNTYVKAMGNSFEGANFNTFSGRVDAFKDSFKDAYRNEFKGFVNAHDNSFTGAKFNTFQQHVNALGNSFNGANNNIFNSTLKASGSSFTNTFNNIFAGNIIASDKSFLGSKNNIFNATKIDASKEALENILKDNKFIIGGDLADPRLGKTGNTINKDLYMQAIKLRNEQKIDLNEAKIIDNNFEYKYSRQGGWEETARASETKPVSTIFAKDEATGKMILIYYNNGVTRVREVTETKDSDGNIQRVVGTEDLRDGKAAMHDNRLLTQVSFDDGKTYANPYYTTREELNIHANYNRETTDQAITSLGPTNTNAAPAATVETFNYTSRSPAETVLDPTQGKPLSGVVIKDNKGTTSVIMEGKIYTQGKDGEIKEIPVPNIGKKPVESSGFSIGPNGAFRWNEGPKPSNNIDITPMPGVVIKNSEGVAVGTVVAGKAYVQGSDGEKKEVTIPKDNRVIRLGEKTQESPGFRLEPNGTFRWNEGPKVPNKIDNSIPTLKVISGN